MNSMRPVTVLITGCLLALAASMLIPSAAAAAAPPVPGLETCGSLPHCHYGPIYDHFPDYKSVCSDDDCFFVSAANWEQVATGITPSPSDLESSYTAAGQTFNGGLSPQDLWAFWKTSGIDGVYLTSAIPVSKSEPIVESQVLSHRALIVELISSRSSFLGLTNYSAGTDFMIVDGYTPRGPLVVYQGATIQMTWSQWNADVRSLWLVSASTTPQTISTQPTSSTTEPTANLTLSTTNLTAQGGTVDLTYSSQDATTCTLTSSPAIWTRATESVDCSGTYQDFVSPASTSQAWTFTFTATNRAGESVSSIQTLVQSASAALTQVANPSTNWSGYVVPSSSALVTNAQGDWAVPTLNCGATPNSDVYIWAGIGGEQWSTGGTSGALLQTGTISNCVGGVQENSAWWEVVPASPNHEQTYTNFPVSAGDEIQADVFELSDGNWETLVNDLNTGLSALMVTGDAWGVGPTTSGTITFTIQGNAQNINYSGGYTAEWIVEDPTDTATQMLIPFADFGSVTLSDLESSFTSWSLTPGEEWGIVDSEGTIIAEPTSNTADDFTDTYTAP